MQCKQLSRRSCACSEALGSSPQLTVTKLGRYGGVLPSAMGLTTIIYSMQSTVRLTIDQKFDKITEQISELSIFVHAYAERVEDRFCETNTRLSKLEDRLSDGLESLEAKVTGINQQLLRHMQITDDHRHDIAKMLNNHEV